MSQVRKNLGVCPQHDVLWKRLTAREHLWLFARLKGVPQHRVDKEIEKILDDTGIEGDRSSDKFPMQSMLTYFLHILISKCLTYT